MGRTDILTIHIACALVLCTTVGCAREIRMRPISRKQAERLTRWLLPLPKELKFAGSVRVATAELQVLTDEGANELIECAAAEFNAMLGARGGRKGFPICIGTESSPMFKKLKGIPHLASVKNAHQAYAIVPIRRSRRGAVRGVALIGRTPVGAYYAAKTFMQLIEGATALARSKSTIALPIVIVRDWPDLEERGQWGGSANKDVEWFADMKMNLIESHCRFGYDKEGKVYANVDQELVERCRKHAVKFVAIITHLEMLGRTGLFEKYPETKGIKGPKIPKLRLQPVCWSKPNARKAVAEWMCEIAKQGGVEHICVWLAEHSGTQCACPDCQKFSQYEAEAKAAVAAYRAAKKVNPQLTLRILLTQGSYKENDKVLAVVPEDVGISYYSGSLTYKSNQEPMIYPLLEKYAAEGGWLGCYPQVTVSWRVVCPWSGPQFIKYRMTEFVNKKLRNLCCYATPSNRFYEFNVIAAAEWSWNSTGRSEREFALAWATRKKLSDPEKAADWAVTLGQVGWNIYGAAVPYPWFFGRMSRCVKDGFPPLGEGPFKYMKSEQEIEDNLAACEKAMKLAQELTDPAILAETKTIRGYVTMVKSIYTIASAVRNKPAQVERLQAAFDELTRAELDVTNGLQAWREAVAPDSHGSHFVDTVNVTHETVTGIGKALVPFGVRDSGKPYRPHKIGSWATKDFDEKEKIQKKWDVTSSIDGAGTYRVRFAYTRGWNGLTMYGVALAAAGRGAPSSLTELALDRHTGTAAYRNRANTYVVKLPSYDPGARYFILADIKGVASRGRPANRQGCEGAVWLVKER